MVISERSLVNHTSHVFYVRLLFPFLVRFLYKYADEIISVSDDVALDLTTNFSVPKSKVKTIHNPIIDILATNQVEAEGDMRLHYILAVGRLHRQKNYMLLLRAFKLIKMKLIADC